MASSGDAADCNQLNTTPTPIISVQDNIQWHKNHEKHEKSSLEPLIGLSVQGYCRNMAVQHGGVRGGGPAPYVGTEGSF